MDSETVVVRLFSWASGSSGLNMFENLQEALLKQIDLFPPRNSDWQVQERGKPWESCTSHKLPGAADEQDTRSYKYRFLKNGKPPTNIIS